MADPLAEIVEKLHTNRWLAHQYLFAKRHKKQSAWFHPELVTAWASPVLNLGFELFRGAAKTTYSEESLAIMGLHREFNYGVIICESEQKAVERLMAIRYQLESNDLIRHIYGPQQGRIWLQNAIELSNGTMLRGLGRGQNIRGEKNPFGNSRPDFFLLDDIETPQDVRTPEARQQTRDWFNREVWPAMEDFACRMRVNGTRLHPECFIAWLENDPDWRETWTKIPLWTVTDGLDVDPDNPTIVSNWPDKFPTDQIRRLIRRFARAHDISGMCQEYLCRSQDETTRHFPKEQMRVEPTSSIPAFAPKYLVIDPARKGAQIKKGNARTGYLACATIGREMWIPEAHGRYDTPEKIVEHTFELYERHNPIWIGIEADGLEEFLWAPFRAEMMRRGVLLPLKALYAPKVMNKDAFILGMAPFWASREIVMCGHKEADGQIVTASVQDLVDELDAFPSGLKDVANCLAYIPQLRGGEPIYADFGPEHVFSEGLDFPVLGHYLMLHGDATMLSAVLAAYGRHGEIAILEDWLGLPTTDELLPFLASIKDVAKLKIVGTPILFKPTGGPAVAIFKREGWTVLRGAQPETGTLTASLRQQIHRQPAFSVSLNAHWALRAMLGGYSRNISRNGQVFEKPADGPYKLIGETMEALAETLRKTAHREDDTGSLTAYTRSGQPYLSLLRRER